MRPFKSKSHLWSPKSLSQILLRLISRRACSFDHLFGSDSGLSKLGQSCSTGFGFFISKSFESSCQSGRNVVELDRLKGLQCQKTQAQKSTA